MTFKMSILIGAVYLQALHGRVIYLQSSTERQFGLLLVNRVVAGCRELW